MDIRQLSILLPSAEALFSVIVLHLLSKELLGEKQKQMVLSNGKKKKENGFGECPEKEWEGVLHLEPRK